MLLCGCGPRMGCYRRLHGLKVTVWTYDSATAVMLCPYGVLLATLWRTAESVVL